jgi:hypothetical protein
MSFHGEIIDLTREINASIDAQKSERAHGEEGDEYFDCLKTAINSVIAKHAGDSHLMDALTIVKGHVTGLRGRTLQRFFLLNNRDHIMQYARLSHEEYDSSRFNDEDNAIVIEIANEYQACVYRVMTTTRVVPQWLRRVTSRFDVLNQEILFLKDGGKEDLLESSPANAKFLLKRKDRGDKGGKKRSHRKKSHRKKSGKKSHRKSRRH